MRFSLLRLYLRRSRIERRPRDTPAQQAATCKQPSGAVQPAMLVANAYSCCPS